LPKTRAGSFAAAAASAGIAFWFASDPDPMPLPLPCFGVAICVLSTLEIVPVLPP